MKVTHAVPALALAVVFASAGYAQQPQTEPNQDTPLFRMEVFGDAMADFSARVSSYVELRNKLAEGLPALKVGSPADVRKAVHALAARIRVARADAKRGDIFTPLISSEMKGALALQVDDSTLGRPGRRQSRRVRKASERVLPGSTTVLHGPGQHPGHPAATP